MRKLPPSTRLPQTPSSVAPSQSSSAALQASLDALMTLVEEIADHFRAEPLSSFPGARCVDVKNAPVYSQEHLDELRQFTSVLTLTFRMAR